MLYITFIVGYIFSTEKDKKEKNIKKKEKNIKKREKYKNEREKKRKK